VVIVALAVLTLVFGRIYCSVICPLGILQDLLARLRRKKNKYSYSKEVRWLRYPVLALFIVAALAGVGSLFQLLAPYSAFGRIATMVLQPLWMLGNNVLAFLAERADSYAFYSVDVWLRTLPTLIIAALDEVAAGAYHCLGDADSAGCAGVARRPNVLQYHLSGGNGIVVPCALLVAEDTVRRGEVPQLLDVLKKLQGRLHRLQDPHGGLFALRGLRQLHRQL